MNNETATKTIEGIWAEYDAVMDVARDARDAGNHERYFAIAQLAEKDREEWLRSLPV